MTVKVSSSTAVALADSIGELETLASRPSLSKQEERKYNLLLSKVSLLKAGLNPSEIAHVEAERLAKQAGVAHIRRVVPTEVEQEYRAMLKGEVRGLPKPVGHEIHELRTQAAGSQSITFSAGAAGGYFVPENFHDRTVSIMKEQDEIFDDENCTVLESETGNAITVPLLDDTTQTSVQVGENTQSAEQDFVAGKMPLGAFSFRSQIVYVSIELLQDSGIPIGMLLEKTFASRHSRGVGQSLTLGAGDGVTTSPVGLITAAINANNIVVAAGAQNNSGVSGNTGANSIGTSDLASLYIGLNKAYRSDSVFAMNDATLLNLLQMVDKFGHPIIGIVNGAPTLFGRRVITCPSMAVIAPSACVIVHYSPSYFYQRRIVAGSFVRRFWELAGKVEAGIVGFESWYRTSSNLAVPNTTSPTYSPACAFVMHS
jgi:HK97 family phage major capsid protein